MLVLGFTLGLAYDTGTIITIGLGLGLRIGFGIGLGIGLKCNYVHRGVHT